MFKLSPLEAKAADLALASAVGEHGIIGWFSVEDLSHLGDGDAVAEWPSRMGGIKLEQTDAGKRPQMALTRFNGGPCVAFDNTSQGMLALHQSGVPSEKVSAIAVFYSDTSSGESCVTEYTGNVYNNRGFRLILKDGDRRVELGADSSRSYVEGGDNASEIKTVMAMRGDRSTNPDTLNLWDQQGLVTPTSSFFTDGSGDHESAYLYVGNRGNIGSLQLNGGIKELIVLAGYVSDNDMHHLLNLVADKHSIPYFDIQPPPPAFVTYEIDNVAGQTITTPSNVLLDSGGSSGGYSPSENYTVTFQAGAGQIVRATITECEIENYYQEGLQFYDDGAFLGNRIYGSASANTGFWASNSLPYVIETTTNVMQINFKSDWGIQSDGFTISVDFV